MFLSKSRMACLVVAAVLGTGCGSKPLGIKGKVMLDGAPLSGASVEFVPEDGGHSAVGTTDSEGKFSLTTYKPGDGALRGEYRVVVKKSPQGALAKPDPSDNEGMKKVMLQEMLANQNRAPQKNVKGSVPSDYGEFAKTPLRQTVPDSKGIYDVELSSSLQDRRAR
jgi:hypothetical protein